ncbi:hypothetical protein [Paralimibaculum aggregatum]|nr:hypothetical protein [Limibaculum sp. NKW23]
MLGKILITSLVLLLVWAVFFRRPARRRSPPVRPLALERCPRCGVHRLEGEVCECGRLGDK